MKELPLHNNCAVFHIVCKEKKSSAFLNSPFHSIFILYSILSAVLPSHPGIYMCWTVTSQLHQAHPSRNDKYMCSVFEGHF